MRFLTVLLTLILAVVGGGVAGFVVAKHEAPAAAQPSQHASTTGTAGQITPASVSERPMSWAEVARRDGPAVVTIINQQAPQTNFFGQTVPGAQDEGSGFVVDTKGDIVTNNHVVAGSQTLNVVFSDGRKVPAQLIRADPYSDLAVVRVHTQLPAILQWGDSAALQPGDPVLAIGSALGEFRNTVTSGVVSALGRTIQESAQVSLHGMIQTDAAINQGNSGGPLLNDHGQVVGINTAINRGSTTDSLFGAGQSVVAEGLGFAIPSNTARNVAQRLMLNRPTAELGIQYVEVSQQLSVYYNLPVGAYVQSVVPNTSASKAGLQPRDIITKIDGRKVTDQSTLDQTVSSKAPGDKVTLTVWRNGKTFTRTVKLGAKS